MKFRELVKLFSKIGRKAYPYEQVTEKKFTQDVQEGKTEGMKKVQIIIEAKPLFLNKKSEEHVTKDLQKKMLICSDSMVVLD